MKKKMKNNWKKNKKMIKSRNWKKSSTGDKRSKKLKIVKVDPNPSTLAGTKIADMKNMKKNVREIKTHNKKKDAKFFLKN